MKSRVALLMIATMITVSASVSCSSSSNNGGTTFVNLEEVQIADDLIVSEAASCDENTICVNVNWAEPTDVFGVHSRNLRLVARAGDDWRLLWEKEESSTFDGGCASSPISLSDDDAAWLYRADKIILSATQTDAFAGSYKPRVLVSSRILNENAEGNTFALKITTDPNLTGAMLAGADLSGLDLSSAALPEADLQCADLSYANLKGANLSGVNLSGTDMSGATWLDGQQCVDPSPDGCDLTVPEGENSNKEHGTFITVTNTTPTALQCTQDCSKGHHNPCSAEIGSRESKMFYGYISVWQENWDINLTCNPLNEIIFPIYIQAMQPAGTSWITTKVDMKTFLLQTQKQGNPITYDANFQYYVQHIVMVRLNGPNSQNTHWGVTQTTISPPPIALPGFAGGISGSTLMRWKTPTQQPEAPITHYTVRWQYGFSEHGQQVVTRTGGDTEEYLYTGLPSGESIQYQVTAWNGYGWSYWSKWVDGSVK